VGAAADEATPLGAQLLHLGFRDTFVAQQSVEQLGLALRLENPPEDRRDAAPLRNVGTCPRQCLASTRLAVVEIAQHEKRLGDWSAQGAAEMATLRADLFNGQHETRTRQLVAA
jgi:hypothetical protein